MRYIRRYYGAPARRGGRVRYTRSDGVKCLGTIRSSKGPYLSILLDGDKLPGRYHPTWNLEYLP
jgi:hypothetical protein